MSSETEVICFRTKGFFSLTVEGHFDSAHRIENAGKCSFLHGHTYKVAVTVETEIDEETGMGIDFRILKGILNGVIEKYDHATLLASDDPLADFLARKSHNVVFVNPSPTAEILAKLIAFAFFKGLNTYSLCDNVKSVSVFLSEGEGNTASFRFDCSQVEIPITETE